MFNPIIKTVRAIREKGVGGFVKQLYMVRERLSRLCGDMLVSFCVLWLDLNNFIIMSHT